MSEELKNTLKYLKNKNNTRRIKTITIDEAHKVIEEIERLNNIINEFDKWIDEESEKTILSTGHLTCLMMCKSKLQELKGSDK